MSTPFPVPCTCPKDREKQRGMASLTAIILLLVLVFMGRGLLYFARQGAYHVQSYQQEMELRLVAESLVEREWRNVAASDDRLQALGEKTSTLWEKGTYEGFPYAAYVRKQEGKIYVIVTTFRRESALDKIIEPHVMVKGVLGKEGNRYVWLGWAP